MPSGSLIIRILWFPVKNSSPYFLSTTKDHLSLLWAGGRRKSLRWSKSSLISPKWDRFKIIILVQSNLEESSKSDRLQRTRRRRRKSPKKPVAVVIVAKSSSFSSLRSRSDNNWTRTTMYCSLWLLTNLLDSSMRVCIVLVVIVIRQWGESILALIPCLAVIVFSMSVSFPSTRKMQYRNTES